MPFPVLHQPNCVERIRVMEANPLASIDRSIYAPLYFSAILCTGFYGVSCMQTFFYYVHYPDDSRRMKIFVAVMWALDTIHEALIVAGVYKYIIAGLENPLSLLIELPELAMLSETLVGLPTQAYFIHRIYIFSGKKIIIPLLWAIPAIYQIVGAIMYEAKSFYSANGSLHVVGFRAIESSFFTSIALSSLSIAAGVDVLIAIAMTYLLLRQRSNAGFARMEHLLQRLTMFAVNTGFWTALFAVLSAILARVYSSNTISAVFSLPLSSVYCNTLLANLNARSYFRGEPQGPSAMIHTIGGDLMIRSQTSGNANANGETKLRSSILNIQKTTEAAELTNIDLPSIPERIV